MKYALLAALLVLPSFAYAENNVSLVVEPQGFTPPLYAGKPLVSPGGTVRLVGMADFRTASKTRLDPASFTYTWVLNDTILSAASGVGKTALVIPSPQDYRSESVTLTVSKAGTTYGSQSVTLEPQHPTMRLYEDDPLQGVLFDKALTGTFALSDAEVALLGVPYSFPLTGGLPTIHWFVNGSTAETGPTITLRPQGEGAGNASLTATADAPGISSPVQAALTIHFGKPVSTFLGL